MNPVTGLSGYLDELHAADRRRAQTERWSDVADDRDAPLRATRCACGAEFYPPMTACFDCTCARRGQTR